MQYKVKRRGAMNRALLCCLVSKFSAISDFCPSFPHAFSGNPGETLIDSQLNLRDDNFYRLRAARTEAHVLQMTCVRYGRVLSVFVYFYYGLIACETIGAL
jgi:hypothetical protein